MKGEVEAIIGTETHHLVAPTKVIIPPDTYHKFTALTEVVGVEIK